MSEYQGRLAKKIKPLSILDNADDADNQRRRGEHKVAVKAREDELFIHYGIFGRGQNSWRKLALELAAKHVPAFASKSGRPPANTGENNLWLMMFAYVKVRDNSSNRFAYRQVATIFQEDVEMVERRLKDFTKLHSSLRTMIIEIFETEMGNGAKRLSNRELSVIVQTGRPE